VEEPKIEADGRERGSLSKEAVVLAAIGIADADGVEAVSMRKVGAAVGVEAMSLYTYVSGKNELLAGMVDAVFAEVEVPKGAGAWREPMRARDPG
jgi:AcrR family transcriptional regulator